MNTEPKEEDADRNKDATHKTLFF